MAVWVNLTENLVWQIPLHANSVNPMYVIKDVHCTLTRWYTQMYSGNFLLKPVMMSPFELQRAKFSCMTLYSTARHTQIFLFLRRKVILSGNYLQLSILPDTDLISLWPSSPCLTTQSSSTWSLKWHDLVYKILCLSPSALLTLLWKPHQLTNNRIYLFHCRPHLLSC